MEKDKEFYKPFCKDLDIKSLLVYNINEDKEMKALAHRISIAPMMV